MGTAKQPESTAKIAEWDRQKGYGFLQFGQQRIFLHRRDFAEHHKQPAVGDVIRFAVGKDAQGRICAQNAAHVNDGGRITLLAVVALTVLLVVPVIALHRLGANFLWVGVYAFVLGCISYGCYAADKRSARQGDWRISEASLHLTELLGGWPGAFLAQRRLRHKVSKSSYLVVFWLIVLGYQLAACDSLQNWKLSRAAWKRISQHGTREATSPRVPVIEIITNTENVKKVR
jgi:uncharacterized membrane protein YsdA (DUF1294 family)/cold shock CspA family protein